MSDGPRHRARQLALRVLFQLEVQQGEWRAPMEYHAPDYQLEEPALQFAAQLLAACVENLGEIDQTISTRAERWPLDQMGAAERAVLRLATGELLWVRSEPKAVVMSEAVNLAGELAGPEAARFVNGVLGRIGRDPVPEGRDGAAAAGR